MSLADGVDVQPRSFREAVARSTLTSREIIAKAQCDRRSYFYWLQGKKPNDYYIGVLSKILGVDLWTIFETQRDNRKERESPKRKKTVDILSTPDETHPHEFGRKHRDIQEVTTNEDMWKTEGGEEVKRRDMLKFVGLTGAALLSNSSDVFNVDFAKQLSQALTRSPYLDSGALDKLDSMTKAYWQLRSLIPVREIVPGVLGHLHMVTELLKGQLSQEARYRLCVIAGKTAMIIGEMSLDSHDYAATQSYLKAAIDAAQESGDTSLLASALGRLGFLYMYAHQFERAITILQETHHLSPQHVHPSLQVWVSLVEAEAYSFTNNAEACKQSLERAETITNNKPTYEDPYLTDMERSTVAAYRGACYLHLQDPEMALPALHSAFRDIDASLAPRRSVILADIANAYAQAGAVDKSCEYVKQSLQITSQIRSGLTIERIQKVRHALDPWKNTAAVQEVDEYLTLGWRL